MHEIPSLLKQLHDLHLPHPVSYWKLAPGWYLILFCLIGCSCFLVSRVMQSRKKHRARLAALIELQQLHKEQSSQLRAQKLAILLKRVALAYYPRTIIAGLHGTAWLQFLDSTGCGKTDFQRQGCMLLTAPYQATVATELEPLLRMSEIWLKQQPNEIKKRSPY